jgi:hypothetical protein
MASSGRKPISIFSPDAPFAAVPDRVHAYASAWKRPASMTPGTSDCAEIDTDDARLLIEAALQEVHVRTANESRDEHIARLVVDFQWHEIARFLCT